MSVFTAGSAASFFAAAVVSIASLPFAGGCVGPAPSADLTPSLAAATGNAQSIVFQADDAAIDSWTPPDVLSLEDAVRRTLKTDPQVQASLARVRIALADAQQVRLLPNPIVAVAFRFPEASGKPVIEASLTAEILSFLQRPRRASAADNRLRAATAEAMVSVLDVIADVQGTYLAVQSFDAKVNVLKQREDLIGQLLNLANARVKAGESSRLDVLVLQNERLDVEASMIEASDEASQERFKLARLIGNPSGNATWVISPWAEESIVSASEANWIAAALQHRPEVQARLWELAALGDEAALARWSALDGLAAGADSERDGKWTVGPALSSPLPLFDWGQAKRARISAEQAEARQKVMQARRMATEEVRRAFSALAASKQLLTKVSAELLPVAQERHTQAQAAYKGGAADITTLIQAEQGLLDARSKLVDSQRRHSTALNQLHRAAGGPAIVPPNATNAALEVHPK